MHVEQMAIAASIWSIAAPVVPIGKNRVGSESRQEARSRQSVVIVVVSNFPRLCDVFHKDTQANQPEAKGIPVEMYWPEPPL
jgi:hypothetical protein